MSWLGSRAGRRGPQSRTWPGLSRDWHTTCYVIGMVSLSPLSSCLYWIPIPFAQNAVPELVTHSPEWDAPVILATHSVQFVVVVADKDPLIFSWTLEFDGHQSPSAQGVEEGTDVDTQWQQVTLQPQADFGEQTLKCVVTDGTTQVTYEWIVVGS